MKQRQKGDEGIITEDWNALVDTHKIVKELVRGGNGTGQTSDNSTILDILIRNDTGEDLTTDFPIVKVGDAIGPSANKMKRQRITMKGELPTGEDDEFIAVIQSPLKDGRIGNAAIGGWTYCMIDHTDAIDDLFASTTGFDTEKFHSQSGEGFPIIWREGGVGLQLAIIDLDNGRRRPDDDGGGGGEHPDGPGGGVGQSGGPLSRRNYAAMTEDITGATVDVGAGTAECGTGIVSLGYIDKDGHFEKIQIPIDPEDPESELEDLNIDALNPSRNPIRAGVIVFGFRSEYQDGSDIVERFEIASWPDTSGFVDYDEDKKQSFGHDDGGDRDADPGKWQDDGECEE